MSGWSAVVALTEDDGTSLPIPMTQWQACASRRHDHGSRYVPTKSAELMEQHFKATSVMSLIGNKQILVEGAFQSPHGN